MHNIRTNHRVRSGNKQGKMKALYDVNPPIDIFYQIEDRVEFADAGNSPYKPTQVANTAFNVMFKTGMFTDGCKIRKQSPEVGKTWV